MQAKLVSRPISNKKPSANFVSKVPRTIYQQEEQKQKDFTGHIDFLDANRLTISKGQNDLTLRTV